MRLVSRAEKSPSAWMSLIARNCSFSVTLNMNRGWAASGRPTTSVPSRHSSTCSGIGSMPLRSKRRSENRALPAALIVVNGSGRPGPVAARCRRGFSGVAPGPSRSSTAPGSPETGSSSPSPVHVTASDVAVARAPTRGSVARANTGRLVAAWKRMLMSRPRGMPSARTSRSVSRLPSGSALNVSRGRPSGPVARIVPSVATTSASGVCFVCRPLNETTKNPSRSRLS